MEGKIFSNRRFSGKLLLFGEHSVIDGSKALIVPWPDVSGILVINPGPLTGEDLASNCVLLQFATWLKENEDPALPKLDMARMFVDIEQGLCLQSSIPKGYGMGSSGALCAAIYDEYGKNKIKISEHPDSENLQGIKKALGAMESWFHGTSSGIDPLCIYFNMPMVIEGKEKITTWHAENIRKKGLHAFLLDTGLTGNTGKLVKDFRKKLHGQSLNESFTAQYIPLVNEIVDEFQKGRPEYDSLVQLSLFQWRIFHDMIPERFWRVWEFGFDWEYYACKLLGSGGGGYILGFTEDFDYTRECLRERFDLDPIRVDIW
jgi:mevalonate kinase